MRLMHPLASGREFDSRPTVISNDMPVAGKSGAIDSHARANVQASSSHEKPDDLLNCNQAG